MFVFFQGLAIRCQIVGENLECTLSLPRKYRTHIEGLAGNFDGDPSNDLTYPNRTDFIPILSQDNANWRPNDSAILGACRSCS